jgi:hypothetical protein
VIEGLWIGNLGIDAWDELEKRYNEALHRALSGVD